MSIGQRNLTQSCRPADEFPVCSYGGLDRVGSRICNIKRVRRNKANFCPAGQNSCERASQFEKLDNQGNTQYVADVDHTQRDFNSIVFNTFIFLQARTPCLACLATIAGLGWEHCGRGVCTPERQGCLHSREAGVSTFKRMRTMPG